MITSYKQCIGYLTDTQTAKGIGVIAARDFEQDEIVEIAPVIQMDGNFDDLHAELQRRVFNWARLAGLHGVHALALGYGSMYNHSNPANLRYSSTNGGTAICFLAAKAIRCGEELTVNYNDTGGDTVSSKDNWFEIQGINPI